MSDYKNGKKDVIEKFREVMKEERLEHINSEDSTKTLEEKRELDRILDHMERYCRIMESE